MKKAKIKIEINDYTIEGIGSIYNDILHLKKEEDIEFDLKNLLLIKKNKELILTMKFLSKEVIYELVEENKKFINNFTIFSLTNDDKQVIIRYRIEDADFLLKINYETIE